MSEVKVNKISPRTNCGTVTVGDSGDSVTVSAGVPVTVNGDLKSNALKATDGGSIISQSGTTITIGASGDTVSLASGASQSGFGRTGTVDWQTTKKTASFTAVSGEGYFVDTSSSAITATLPASPSAGAIVYIKDYTGTFGINACTVARNSSNIRGGTDNFLLEKSNAGAVFIYVDATEGWQVFVDGSDSDVQATFIQATGGTITTSGDFKIHTFTGPGTFVVSSISDNPSNNTADYLVVAGGGGGAGQHSGGGGAGGTRFSDCHWCAPSPVSPNAGTALPVSVQSYPITVGSGGAGDPNPGPGSIRGVSGGVSTFSTITSAGGGGGGKYAGPEMPGLTGGSGGGGGSDTGTGGAGNTPPVSPSQGNNGGNGASHNSGGGGGGGGGGMGAVGSNASSPNNPAGNGGAGLQINIDGNNYYWAGGGGGGIIDTASTNAAAGNGGIGGGGGGGNARNSAGGAGGGSAINCGSAGGTQPTPGCGPADGGNGGTNSGGGGGGGGSQNDGGGNGGSGVVVIRYKFQ